MTYDELKVNLKTNDDLSVELNSSDSLNVELSSMIDTQELQVHMEQENTLDVNMDAGDNLEVKLLEGIPVPMDDYIPLHNKPSINGVELIGDKSFEDLGRDDIKNARIKQIIDEQYDLIFGGN